MLELSLPRLSHVLRHTLALGALLLAGLAQAQTGTIKLLVGFPPGGGTDAMARILAEKLKEQLGSPVIVESRAAQLILQLFSQDAGHGVGAATGWKPDQEFDGPGLCLRQAREQQSAQRKGVAQNSCTVPKRLAGMVLRRAAVTASSG